MSFLQSLINGPSPRSLRGIGGGAPAQQPTAQVSISESGGSSGAEQMLALIEQTTGNPIGQEIVRGLLQQEFGFRIPSRRELDLQDAQIQSEQIKIQKAQRLAQTKGTLSILIDGAEDPAAEALFKFGQLYGIIAPGDSEMAQALVDQFGDQKIADVIHAAPGGEGVGSLDAGLVKDPRKLRAASQIVGGIFDRMLGAEGQFTDQVQIGFSDLVDFPFTAEGATTSPTDLARQESSAQAKSGRDLDARAQFISGIIDGSSDSGKLFEEAKDLFEDQYDVDLDPNLFGFGDLDTERGAQVFVGDFSRFVESLTTEAGLGNDALYAIYREKEIPKLLMRHTNIENGVVTGADKVGAIYIDALRGFAEQTGVSFDQVAGQIGFPARDVNLETKIVGDALGGRE